MKTTTAFALFGLFFHLAFAQSVDTARLDQYFQTLVSHDKFMGSVALYKDVAVCYQRQFGFTDRASQTKANARSKYRIASISKTFTAVLVFQAIEEGHLSLGETIAPYFPTLKNAQKITIAHLLQHRSGIPGFTDDRAHYLSSHTQAKSEADMLELLAGYDSNFEPGTQAAYSNSNYLLLSYLLEKKYQQSFAQILQEKICGPLGLEDTYHAPLLSADRNEACSYTFDRRWTPATQSNGTTGLGAGSLVSTPADLLRFADALFNGQLLTTAQLNKMKTVQDRFGMGLFRIPYYELTSYGHNGGMDGFVALFRYFPTEKIAMAVTCNALNYDFNAIETTIVHSLLGKHFDLPILSVYQPKPRTLKKFLAPTPVLPTPSKSP
ncbi:MAG: serine hydrolase domain-containing protein [Bacteroidota bacterium]